MIKKKINRNNFFYKFYLYYRLIYKEKIFINKKTYSQSGEDKFITSYMNKKKIFNGRYVDLGAFHPTKYSNTCLLYKSGWSGINIDCFNIVRPNDKNICVAVSDKEKKRKVYINDIFSPLNTLNKNHAKIFNFEFNYKDGYDLYKVNINSDAKIITFTDNVEIIENGKPASIPLPGREFHLIEAGFSLLILLLYLIPSKKTKQQ